MSLFLPTASTFAKGRQAASKLVPEATDSIDPRARQMWFLGGRHPGHGACPATCSVVQVIKPNRSVQLMLTVRIGRVNTGTCYPGAASRDDPRNQLISNDKNVAAASFSRFQDRTERFGSQLFVIGNGNRADPFRGGPSDANFHYGTPLDGHDF
ncbi:hypothetical protein [Mesorhizobium sp. B1-1-5]|uniref:hypothetical protein n=1 Tax=Mesorhizobium sp. B1-1-5 TaxID=2589979 RepID=UPI001129796C|nr:hypothetical protein [Mesorhizobium sp. B1-1-5]TPO13692.1 hypothetical protein FJ980_00470 [Mesorhizobium sp. B1-1-5]